MTIIRFIIDISFIVYVSLLVQIKRLKGKRNITHHSVSRRNIKNSPTTLFSHFSFIRFSAAKPVLLFLYMLIVKEVDINKTTQTLCRIIKQSKLSAHKETTIIKNHLKISSDFLPVFIIVTIIE